MSRPRSLLRNRLEDSLVGFAMLAVRSLPENLVLAAACGMARVAGRVVPGRRRRTQELVARRLGLPPDSPEAGRIVAGAFRVLALNTVETLLVERALRRGEAVERFVTVEGGEHFREALAAGRGVLLCTGHLGAWELSPLLVSRLFTPIWVVARMLDNPILEQRLVALRGRFTRGTIDKDGGGLKLARALRAGEAVGLLLDQNAGRSGVILDFLGAPASQHTVAGIMSRRFGAPALPAYLLREPGRLRYRLVIEAPIRADPCLAPDAAELDVTRRVAASMEAQVRAHPEQWLWLHDRWRHAERVLRLQQRRQAEARDTTGAVVQGTNGG